MRLVSIENSQLILAVSIHASVKDATLSDNLIGIYDGFNPRICKRCDAFCNFPFFISKVSIHASVKDATKCYDQKNADEKVSIHASVKDATIDPGDMDMDYLVSIHASVKDATVLNLFVPPAEKFQSTHL